MNAVPPRNLVDQVKPLPAALEAPVLAFARALARQLAAEHHKALEQAEPQKRPGQP